MESRPLVLTAMLPAAEQQWLDDWRTEFFPHARNFLPAHLTLFHAVPGAELGAVVETLARTAVRTPPLPARASGLRPLGLGVAVQIEAPELVALRAGLADAWSASLTRQDRQPLKSHVTVCNKVSRDRAREVEAELSGRFAPRAFVLPGLALFAYAGGPWEPLAEFAFEG